MTSRPLILMITSFPSFSTICAEADLPEEPPPSAPVPAVAAVDDDAPLAALPPSSALPPSPPPPSLAPAFFVEAGPALSGTGRWVHFWQMNVVEMLLSVSNFTHFGWKSVRHFVQGKDGSAPFDFRSGQSSEQTGNVTGSATGTTADADDDVGDEDR